MLCMYVVSVCIAVMFVLIGGLCVMCRVGGGGEGDVSGERENTSGSHPTCH